MHINCDLSLEQFVQLNRFIAGEWNRSEGGAKAELGYAKVEVIGIKEASYCRGRQTYRGVNVVVDDAEITQPQLTRLMRILYQPQK